MSDYAKAHDIVDSALVDMEDVDFIVIPYGDAKFISHVLERAAFDFRRVGRSLGRILNHD